MQRVSHTCCLGWMFVFIGLFLWHTASAQILADEPLAITTANSIFAQNTLTALKQQYQLVQDRNNENTDAVLRLKKEKTNVMNQPIAGTVNRQTLNLADLEVALANSNLESANLTKAEAEQVADTVNTRINNLENQLQTVTLAAGKTEAVKAKIASMQSELSTQKDILKWQNRLVQALATSQDLAKQRYTILSTWRDQLYNIYQMRQKQIKDEKIQMVEKNLQRQQGLWLARLQALNKQMAAINKDTLNGNDVRSALELQILEVQEQSNLLKLDGVLLKLKLNVNEMFEPLPMDPKVQILKNRLNDGNGIMNELDSLKSLITQKLEILQKRLFIEKNKNTNNKNQSYALNILALQKLINAYQNNLNSIIALQQKVANRQQVIQRTLNKSLARRQSLPGFNFIAWQELTEQVMTMPGLAMKAGVALKDQVIVAASKMSLALVCLLIAAELIWLWLWLRARHGLGCVLRACKMSSEQLRDKSRYVMLQLCKRNMSSIYILLSVAIAFWFMDLSLTTFSPLLYLLLVWFIFKFALGLAKIILLENVDTLVGADVRLYRDLYWALMIGGALSMLTVLAHQLPIGYEVTDFFNRFFMLFLLVTSLVLLKNWRVMPMLLSPYIVDKKSYLHKAIQLLALLVPLIVLSTAFVGLLGYVDLAWTLSKYEGLLLLVMIGYIIVRGFLKDIIEWVSDLLVSQFQHGWLWRQAFLKPIDKLMRLCLLIAAGTVLFWLYGWDKDSFAYGKLVELMHMHLIDTKGLSLTVENLLSLIIAGVVVSWITKWSREFAFRWLYAKQRDIGVRNSLATLTQYIIFICSIFLALKIIGVDLSGVSYVLAGFAAGVGLGLRDIIKNYASGLLLLFERPVKTGDMVTIGNFEGEVTHMGMRAMTLKTSDHMQVLVPNSETFEKPFTNWTYADTIIRTVIALKVVREDDANHVRAVILSVLQQIPAVLGDPPPQIYLMNMDDALLEFEIRYFINMQLGRTRTEIRSEVLFSLLEAFKTHHIRTPYQQQDINIKHFPNLLEPTKGVPS